jgi:hypothetical protein
VGVQIQISSPATVRRPQALRISALIGETTTAARERNSGVVEGREKATPGLPLVKASRKEPRPEVDALS